MNSILVAGIPFVSAADKGTADGIPGQFSSPAGIAVDANYYYVADGTNKTIRRISRNTGYVETIAGVAGLAGTADGNRAVARFRWPMELLLSGTTLYISDFTNNCIRAIDVSNSNFPVTTVLGLCGTGNSGAADGIGTNARFSQMAGMAIVGGFLYVTDFGNSTIRRVQLSDMQVTTVAGTAGSIGTTDDVGAAARFRTPWGLTHYHDLVAGDVLFITDQGNHTIRRMKLSDYSVTTIAGVAHDPGFVNSVVGLLAKFNSPWGITNDGQALYVADSANRAVRKISLNDYSVTTFFGDPSFVADTFGALSDTEVSTLSALNYDTDLGLLGTTLSAVFRIGQ